MKELEILKNLVTYAPINKKIRLGRLYDGGYIMIDGYDYDYLISGGIGNDISFEIDFIKKYPNVQGVIFDAFVNMPNDLPKEIKFVKKMIGLNTNETYDDLTNYVKDYKNMFVKLDIESGEWSLLRSEFTKSLINVKQIVVEIHHTFTLDLDYVLECLQNVNKTHYLVHVHENNNGLLYTIENIEYPELLELTFIRKDCEINGLNTTDLPIKDLDYPNIPTKIEHNMNMWPFNSK